MFIPKSIPDLAQMLFESNGGEVNEWQIKLEVAADLKRRRQTCMCGNPIWAVGSVLAGSSMCYTCITGSADPSDDFEISGFHQMVDGRHVSQN